MSKSETNTLGQRLISKEQKATNRLHSQDTGISCFIATANIYQEPLHAAFICSGTSHNGLNVYVVSWQTASLTLLRWDHPLQGRAAWA